VKDDPVAGAVRADPLDGLVDLGQGHQLDFWFDLVAGGEGEHLIHHRAIRVVAAADAPLRGDKIGGVEGQSGWPADEAQGSVGAQKGEDEIPIEGSIGRAKEKIELEGGRGVFPSVEVVRAKIFRLFFLGGGAGNGRHFAPVGMVELQGEVAEPSDADDADRMGWEDRVAMEGGVDGCSSAEEGSGVRRIDPLGDRKSKTAIDDDVVGKTPVAAVVVDSFFCGANVRISLQTLGAL